MIKLNDINAASIRIVFDTEISVGNKYPIRDINEIMTIARNRLPTCLIYQPANWMFVGSDIID